MAIPASKERVDKVLVRRGLARSRDEARRLILAGQVVVGDQRVEKAGTLVGLECTLRVKLPAHPFVGRGGVKLEAALEKFKIDVGELVAIDVGASTGGFTDCLLQRGVSKVFALDVGYGQLAWKLRQDPRVVVMERTNIRHLDERRLGERLDLATIDVSFISLKLVLPRVSELLADSGSILALVKPQFEVGRGQVGKGGVVRDPEQHQRVVAGIKEFAQGIDLRERGEMESPIAGADGNREFFLWLSRRG